MAPFVLRVSPVPPEDARRSDRHALLTAASVQQPSGALIGVIVEEVSQHGFRGIFPEKMRVGAELWVDLEEESTTARIVWQSGVRAGCEFSQPIPAEAVRLLLARTEASEFVAPREDLRAEDRWPGWVRGAIWLIAGGLSAWLMIALFRRL
jgi:hypothetical protein